MTNLFLLHTVCQCHHLTLNVNRFVKLMSNHILFSLFDCMFEITQNELIDPKGPENNICTILKYRETLKGRHACT